LSISDFIIANKGILIGMPHSYYHRVLQEDQGVALGALNSYGTGIVFTPKGDESVAAIKEIFESKVKQFGMKVLTWRNIETGDFQFLIFACHQNLPLLFN